MTTTFAERLAALIKVIKADVTALYAHVASVANPHAVTKSQVGLGSVDNTSDADKPVSTAAQTAFDALPSDFELGSAAYVDMVRLYGAATYDPPSLTANTATTTTVTVPGAEFGDFIYPSFSADMALSVTGRVSAANTVTLTYANLTASTVDAASHTVYVQIEKRLPL